MKYTIAAFFVAVVLIAGVAARELTTGAPAPVTVENSAPGWSYAVRLYRPRAELLDGTWKFPEAQPVS